MLLTYSVLGFVYAFGIIMSNMKRGMRLIVAVPGAMLGSLASVAKIISYTVLMIAELVLNIMLYMLTTDLIFSVASVITITFVNTASGIFSTAFVSSGAFSTLVSILVIIFLIWFTVQAIKLRNPIIKSLEEMADNVVTKFITGQTAGGNAQGSGGQGDSTAARGAQIAAMEPKRRFRTPVGRAAEKMKDTSKQEAFLGQMFGGNGSAFKEDQAFRQRDLEKRAAKKHARREMLEAGKQLAAGAGEFAAGAATGNAALMAQGAKTTLHGIGTANQAAENKYQADKNADTKLAATLNPTMAKHDERLGYTKGQSKEIDRMPLGTELVQAVRPGGAGSDNAVPVPKPGPAGGSINSGADFGNVHTGTENAGNPMRGTADNTENDRNIRRQSRSTEKISVDNEVDQEVQVNNADGNKILSAGQSGSADNGIPLKGNVRVNKNTVRDMILSEADGFSGSMQDSGVDAPNGNKTVYSHRPGSAVNRIDSQGSNSRTVGAGITASANNIESSGQKDADSYGKSTGKSISMGRNEEIHVQSAKKVVEHVKEKHETVNEYAGEPSALDGYESHNFVEQKLLTHIDQTGDIIKKQKRSHSTDDRTINRYAEKHNRLPKKKKNK